MRDSVPSGSYSSVCNVLRQWKSRSSLLIESTNSMIPTCTCTYIAKILAIEQFALLAKKNFFGVNFTKKTFLIHVQYTYYNKLPLKYDISFYLRIVN